jgi:hypothetical protein
MEATDQVYQILRDAKALARRYYHLTGKPLGVTGEVAEYEAARILNLELELARQAGYDATQVRSGLSLRNQIKGRYPQSSTSRWQARCDRLKAAIRHGSPDAA